MPLSYGISFTALLRRGPIRLPTPRSPTAKAAAPPMNSKIGRMWLSISLETLNSYVQRRDFVNLITKGGLRKPDPQWVGRSLNGIEAAKRGQPAQHLGG